MFSLETEDYLLGTLVTVITLISFIFPYYSLYSISIKEVADLRSSYYSNLGNILKVSNKINSNAFTVNESILDQSIKDTDILKEYAREINRYNKKLYLEQAKRNSGLFIGLWYGWLYPLDKDMKVINLKI